MTDAEKLHEAVRQVEEVLQDHEHWAVKVRSDGVIFVYNGESFADQLFRTERANPSTVEECLLELGAATKPIRRTREFCNEAG